MLVNKRLYIYIYICPITIGYAINYANQAYLLHYHWDIELIVAPAHSQKKCLTCASFVLYTKCISKPSSFQTYQQAALPSMSAGVCGQRVGALKSNDNSCCVREKLASASSYRHGDIPECKYKYNWCRGETTPNYLSVCLYIYAIPYAYDILMAWEMSISGTSKWREIMMPWNVWWDAKTQANIVCAVC